MGQVTLSFDNGPDPEVTPLVLKALARRGIRSSFFVVGNKLAQPGGLDLAREAAAEGHWIGNHTFSHDPPLGPRSSPTLAEEEIGRTQALIGELSHPDRLFRPSGTKGALDHRMLDRTCLQALIEGQYSCVLWHSVPGDLWPATDWVVNATGAIGERDWTLLVLHDIRNGCIARLEEFLDRLAGEGTAIRQDFPPDCMPIVRGEVLQDMSAYVHPPGGAAG